MIWTMKRIIIVRHIKKVICADLCYDSMMCLNRFFKVSSTKELEEIKDIEAARVICSKCPYSQG